MSSRAVIGKPGGSKTFFVTKYGVVEELEHGDRNIVTNVPLLLDALSAYFKQKGKNVAVHGRVQLLEHEEVKEFWRYRGPFAEPLPPVSKDDWEKGIRPDFESIPASGDAGVLYVIDELHEHMNSREWKSTGPVLLYYIAKHRHLGDDVYWVTQAPKNVDSQWRSVTQEYILCRNYGKESFRGFSKGNRMEAVCYLSMPTGGQNDAPQWSKQYTLDKKVAACYKTSVFGGAGDVGQKIKALPWWLGIALVIAFIVALVYGTDLVSRAWAGEGPVKKSERSSAVSDHRPVPERGVGQPVPMFGAPLSTPSLAVQEIAEKNFEVIAVPLKYSTALPIVDMLKAQAMLGQGCSVAANGTNDAVIVTGNDIKQVIAIAEVVRRYDKESALLTVHCVVARRLNTRGNEVGLFEALSEAGRPDTLLGGLMANLSYDLATGLVTMGGVWTAREALNLITRFVSTDSRFDVMSHPTLSVLSGKEAVFASGREIPVPTTVRDASGSQTSIEYKKAEFVFTVRPTLQDDGTIRVEMDQSNSDVLQSNVIAGNQIPELSTQKMTTMIEVRPNQLLYLGGMKSTLGQASNKGTPYLRNVPVVGWILGRDTSREETAELFVIMTVEVWKRGQSPVRVERAIPVKKSAKPTPRSGVAGAR